jgi:hypothetical protein
MAHVWNEQHWVVYSRTFRVLYDAGIDEKLADELATQRALDAALNVARAQNHLNNPTTGPLDLKRHVPQSDGS